MSISTTDMVLSKPVNLRDLAGIPVAGGVVREGFAIRSDDLSIVTDEFARELVARGLVAMIDLRSNDEAAVTGRGPLAGCPIAYHHLPLIADINESMSKEDLVVEHREMGEMYIRMFEDAAPQIVTALNIIAHAPGATAFHCAAGRDRTGVLAASLLLVLGATDDDIVADYARTGPNMHAILDRTHVSSAALLERLGFGVAKLAGIVIDEGPMDVSMRIFLAGVRSRHGYSLAPLTAAGLGRDTVDRLRRRALIA